jgi:nitrite reductase/ring-hydroxylating ferredoxin subunit
LTLKSPSRRKSVLPLHNSRFNVCTGKAMEEPAEEDLRTYPVREEGGRVLIGVPGEGS